MIVLVSGATVNVAAADPKHIGVLVVSGQRGIAFDQLARRVWAADNAAFSGFDAGAYVRMLERLRGVAGCRFVAAPDVPFDAAATRAQFRTWAPTVRTFGLPVALVAQDGLTVPATPWDEIDALFIGGSTAWKLSPAVDTLLAYAAARGKWRHVGRVNTRGRFRHFRGRCDSVDGSGFSRWPRHVNGRARRWLRELEERPSLLEL